MRKLVSNVIQSSSSNEPLTRLEMTLLIKILQYDSDFTEESSPKHLAPVIQWQEKLKEGASEDDDR
jgi:hypothetical protein